MEVIIQSIWSQDQHLASQGPLDDSDMRRASRVDPWRLLLFWGSQSGHAVASSEELLNIKTWFPPSVIPIWHLVWFLGISMYVFIEKKYLPLSF